MHIPMKMSKEYKFTQKQFDWLVDVIMTHNEYNDSPYSIRKQAMELLKTYGYKGWYDVDGKSSLTVLTQMVRESKQRRYQDVDDLPF